MTDLLFTQAEADALIRMAKRRLDDTQWDYPLSGEKVSVPLVGEGGREDFMLDVRTGRIDLSKGTQQNRSMQVIVLVRLDFGGAPHRNPNEEEIASPHLHLYREGFGDKYAFRLPPDQFPNIGDPRETLHDFMRYCNILEPPVFVEGVFP